MRTAIVGLPQAGKSSLFTILTGARAARPLDASAATLGVARLPDPRLAELARVFRPAKVTPASLEYLDVPAVSRESLRDPAYIASLRLADAFAHVLRLFEEETIPHPAGSLDPARDWKNLELELILTDLEVIEKRLERLGKDLKKMPGPDLEREQALLARCKTTLESECPLRDLDLDAEGSRPLRGFQLLSQKPMLLVLNVGEAQAASLRQMEGSWRAAVPGGSRRLEVAAFCGKIEAEIAELEPEEATAYLASYGLGESGLERLMKATFSLLGLLSFLTASETEVRVWTVPSGASAWEAAGAIHSDFQKRFIRAEVIGWQELADLGGYAGARQKGRLRLEGKHYIVQEGDVLLIRHG